MPKHLAIWKLVKVGSGEILPVIGPHRFPTNFIMGQTGLMQLTDDGCKEMRMRWVSRAFYNPRRWVSRDLRAFWLDSARTFGHFHELLIMKRSATWTCKAYHASQKLSWITRMKITYLTVVYTTERRSGQAAWFALWPPPLVATNHSH